ncbi:hypothetical protein C0058_25180 [Pseudomonas sp. NC02]|nr:hypothetical protein C0058_25180 [Pseudomonas sp. NC02]
MGAGLLAKAVGQPMHPLTDTPLSRASPLPHLICHVSNAPRFTCPAPQVEWRLSCHPERTSWRCRPYG